MADDWKIAKRKPHCTSCGRDFAPEEEHYSGIAETEEGFARQDICLACWEKKPSEPFSYWRTRTPPKAERRLENVQAMMDFFQRLVSEPLEDPTRCKVAYLTSLLLMRRRRIKLRGTSRGSLELEKTWDGETVTIPDPAIAEEDIPGLREHMERLFHAGVEPAAPVS